LWDVDDRTTAQLMEQMYSGISAGEPPPRALREAKLALVRQNGRSASPYTWGAFELFTVAP
jgi:CHAT domain-containing protein